jgi:hypothetical protein
VALAPELPDTPIDIPVGYWPRYYTPRAAAAVTLDEREAAAEPEAEIET